MYINIVMVVFNIVALPLYILLEVEMEHLKRRDHIEYLSRQAQYPPLQLSEQYRKPGGSAHCWCIPQLFGTYPLFLVEARQST